MMTATTTENTFTACRSTHHCVTWGWCHLCNAQLTKASTYVVRAIDASGLPTGVSATHYSLIMDILSGTSPEVCSCSPRHPEGALSRPAQADFDLSLRYRTRVQGLNEQSEKAREIEALLGRLTKLFSRVREGIAADSRNWQENPFDAQLYAMFAGEEAAFDGVARAHGWSPVQLSEVTRHSRDISYVVTKVYKDKLSFVPRFNE